MAALLTQVRPLAEGEEEKLLAFARGYYGERAHQANARRFEWLYKRNPLTAGARKDVVVATASDGRVVGCHWKTRLAWRWEDDRVVIPSLHDLHILPEYRHGYGLALVLAALAGEKKAALLGLSTMSEGIYKRMRCPEAPMARLRKVISYGRTMLGIAGWRRGVVPREAHREETSVWIEPPEDAIRPALQLNYAGPCHLDWTPETYRWRFFHELGPKNALVLMGKPGQPVARAVFSLGRRKGAVMARLVDAAVADPKLYAPLFRSLEWAMQKFRVAVATAVTTSEHGRDCLLAMGWRPYSEGVSSRFFLRGASTVQLGEVWGGSYDYGFDAD
jgi:hypothetical protein